MEESRKYGFILKDFNNTFMPSFQNMMRCVFLKISGLSLYAT